MAYAAEADVRALDGIGADDAPFSDAQVATAIAWATEIIDRYCGTSFEYKNFSVTLDGNGRIDIPTGVLFPQTLSSVTIDGTAVTTTGWKLRPEGVIVRNDGGVFTFSSYGMNVVIAGTAGFSSAASEEIKWAARTIARQYLLDLKTRIPGNALTVESQNGQFEFAAQAGGPGRPTNLPAVNAVLNRHKHKPGNVGSVLS